MFNFVKKTLNFGTEKEHISTHEKHPIRLINLICVCTIIANFLGDLFTFEILDWSLLLDTFLNNIGFAIVLFLNYKQKTKIAKWVLVSLLLVILINVPFLVPHSLNADGLYLVIIVIFAAIVNDTKTILILTSFVLALLIGWHLADYYSLLKPINNFKEDQFLIMEINYSVIMVVFLVIALLSFKKTATDFQKELSNGIKEKEMLLKEVHHRVKNNLQLIISMLGLRENGALSLESKGVIKDLKAKIVSMAIIHNKLYQKDGISVLGLEEYITQLTDLLIEAYNNEKIRVEKTIAVEYTSVGIELSIPLGLIITEIIANSFKHAFKRNKIACLEISGNRTNNDFFVLKIKDNGVGLPPAIDLTDSFGFSLIEMLCNQIEAKLERSNNNGLETSITFRI